MRADSAFSSFDLITSLVTTQITMQAKQQLERGLPVDATGNCADWPMRQRSGTALNRMRLISASCDGAYRGVVRDGDTGMGCLVFKVAFDSVFRPHSRPP
jgi:hypothetical protein